MPKNLHKTLLRMRELSLALIEARAQRGALSLETAETQLCLDASGEPLDVIPRPSGDAERLIESFMLLANEAVAAYARAKKLPFPYRVHEPSAPEDLTALNQAMAHFGYPPCPDGKPASLNALLALARGKPEEPLVQFAVVRSMQKARYSEQPKGHFALALRDYCHFTSPIRRYPDLLAHRILKLALAGDFSQRERYKKNMPEWTDLPPSVRKSPPARSAAPPPCCARSGSPAAWANRSKAWFPAYMRAARAFCWTTPAKEPCRWTRCPAFGSICLSGPCWSLSARTNSYKRASAFACAWPPSARWWAKWILRPSH